MLYVYRSFLDKLYSNAFQRETALIRDDIRCFALIYQLHYRQINPYSAVQSFIIGRSEFQRGSNYFVHEQLRS